MQTLRYFRTLIAAMLLSLAGMAHATFTPTAIDTADVVSQIGVVPAAIAAIGIAVLLVIAVGKAYKWVRKGF